MKAAVFALGLVMMSACSSSKTADQNAATDANGETAAAADANTTASTDAVPASDSGAPGALAANQASDPNMPNAPAPLADSGAAVASGSSIDLPPSTEVKASDPAPVAESGALADNSAIVGIEDSPEPVTHKKHKKHGKSKSAPVSGDGTQYTVRRGDTLMKIAFEQYGDLYRWKEIYEANRANIQDPNHVPPGTQLSLNGAGMVSVERNGERYLIKTGDTLGLISKDVYGTPRKWKRLWENNRELIKDPNKIYAGFYLFYQPEGKLTNGSSKTKDPAASEAPAVEGDYGASKGRAPKMNTGVPVTSPGGDHADAPRLPASATRVPPMIAAPK